MRTIRYHRWLKHVFHLFGFHGEMKVTQLITENTILFSFSFSFVLIIGFGRGSETDNHLKRLPLRWPKSLQTRFTTLTASSEQKVNKVLHGMSICISWPSFDERSLSIEAEETEMSGLVATLSSRYHDPFPDQLNCLTCVFCEREVRGDAVHSGRSILFYISRWIIYHSKSRSSCSHTC